MRAFGLDDQIELHRLYREAACRGLCAFARHETGSDQYILYCHDLCFHMYSAESSDATVVYTL
jgi:hypothetical protein